MTTPPSLSPATAPNRPKTGIVHLGLGAFFRAHGAVYVQAALDRYGGDWAICGVSLRAPDVRDRLAPQRFNYSAVAMAEQGMQPPVSIQCLHTVLVAPEDPDAVVEAMTDPAIRLVTLTVTEKGYHRGAGGEPLDLSHPDIQHDLTHKTPKTAPGFIVRALQQRKAQGFAPFTVVSLDNLPANGRVIKAAVCALAERLDPSLEHWIAEQGRFPFSMVDRIVPATTPELIQQVAEAHGLHDPCVVAHEPFCQWVLEDAFVGDDRPPFEAVGVQMVSDVEPFERMKLRMLNGSHSALAYIGWLKGHETVAEAIADPELERFIEALWTEEFAPSLTAPPGTDLAEYASTLKARYHNPNIRHRLRQIAMDGSQKLPQRILDPLFENLNAGRSVDGLVTVIAAWMAFVRCCDQIGEPLGDPHEQALMEAARAAGSENKDLVTQLLTLDAVFGGYPMEQISDVLACRLAEIDCVRGG